MDIDFKFIKLEIFCIEMLLKSFISCGLSFLILSSNFHIDLRHEDHNEGSSICNIDCGKENHHSISHSCEKCLTKSTKSLVQILDELSHDLQIMSLQSVNDWCPSNTKPFNLYSRPPPKPII